jgi:hypothetical protein
VAPEAEGSSELASGVREEVAGSARRRRGGHGPHAVEEERPGAQWHRRPRARVG